MLSKKSKFNPLIASVTIRRFVIGCDNIHFGLSFGNRVDRPAIGTTRDNAPYNEIDISKVDGAMDEMIKKANGKRTIPQIFFDDEHIGGYDETRALEKENKLQDLLK